MKKGFFKKTGALMLAATLTVSMVQVPVYGATTKAAEQSAKGSKGKESVFYYCESRKEYKSDNPKRKL